MMLLALMAATCLPVAGPHITAKEIAAAVPGYAPRDAGVVFGYAPMPGVRRVVHPAEMQQFLQREQFAGAMPTSDTCFERPMVQLDSGVVKAAMQRVLGSEAQIELVEVSRFPVPIGVVAFDRRDLGTPPIAFWHGYVVYEDTKKFPIWARIKVTVRSKRMIALEDLRPGTPIRPEQVTLQEVEDFPGARITPLEARKVAGALPRRYINANTPVWEDAIEPPNQITKGDRVLVTVRSGSARLTFDAEATSSARLGDMASFKNPESGKLFRARVSGPEQASIESPSSNP